MHEREQDNLTLWSQYGDLYNEIVRPERKYTISHYLRTRWAPLLGAARFWFVIALRQRCFWNDKQDWCVVDKKTLARESGLSLRTVNRIVASADQPSPEDDRDRLAAWFFDKTQRRRYNQQIGRTVNAPNRYHVLLDDPLTPGDQAALAHYLSRNLTDRSPEGTLQVLQALCECPETQLHQVLLSPAAPPPPADVQPAAFVFDIVQAQCPMPAAGSTLYAKIAQAASRLHNSITRPERVYVGNQYFRLHWVPALGSVLASLVVNLRARCYWNERTGELRDTCQVSWSELAEEVGCTARQLRNLRQNPDLSLFVTLLAEGHGRARSRFRVCMADPLTPSDQQQFEKQIHTKGDLRVDPETGQIDAYGLINKAEVLTSGSLTSTTAFVERTPGSIPQAENLARSQNGQAEILAHSERKFWHLEGLETEVLAPQAGNFGTTIKILFITPTQKGLAETALAFSPDQSDDHKSLAAAAVLDEMLTQIGVQQPNRSRLVARHPRCDWVAAWGLYALTQQGLSANKPGYVYNRLWAGDPPPAECLEVVALSPPTWRWFCQAMRRGEPGLLPASLAGMYVRWQALLGPVWDQLQIDLDVPLDRPAEVMADVVETAVLPPEIRALLTEDEEVEQTGDGWEIATWDLYQAYRLARLVMEHRLEDAITVIYCDVDGMEHVLNAEILALAVEPLASSTWQSIQLELSWLMARSVFERRWRGVQPLGLVSTEPPDVPCVVLCAPVAEARDWIVSQQMPIIERTLYGVLGFPVQVRFMVYGREQPAMSLSPP